MNKNYTSQISKHFTPTISVFLKINTTAIQHRPHSHHMISSNFYQISYRHDTRSRYSEIQLHLITHHTNRATHVSHHDSLLHKCISTGAEQHLGWFTPSTPPQTKSPTPPGGKGGREALIFSQAY